MYKSGIHKVLINNYKVYTSAMTTRIIKNPCYPIFAKRYSFKPNTSQPRSLNVDYKNYCSSYLNEEVNTRNEETTNIYPYTNKPIIENIENARQALFKDANSDPIIFEITKCASVNEILNFTKENSSNLLDKHLTCVILLIKDLQTICMYHMDNEIIRKEDFLNKLNESKEFQQLLSNIDSNLSTYNTLYLSYAFLSLFKLGISIDLPLMQDIAWKLRSDLLTNGFTLEIAANLFDVVFQEDSIRPYYLVTDIIPKIFKEIDNINSVNDLEYMARCLSNHLYSTETILNLFARKVKNFMENNRLKNDSSTSTLLKIIYLYKYPKWRDQFSWLISDCLLMLEKSVDLLHFKNIEFLCGIIYTLEEPGEALNTYQRCSAKFLHQLEESDTQRGTRINLFTFLTFFSSPSNLAHFQKDIRKLIDSKEPIKNLTALRRLIIELRNQDINLWNIYWNRALECLKENRNYDHLYRLMENYLTFTNYYIHYRHYSFEYYIMEMAKAFYRNGDITLIMSMLCQCLSFALIYCKDKQFLNALIHDLKKRQTQIKAVHCLKLSLSLNFLRQVHINNIVVDKKQIDELKQILKKSTERIYKYSHQYGFPLNTLLVRAALLRNDYDNELIDQILNSYKKMPFVSAKLLRTICSNLSEANSLIPEAINCCTEYVRKNPNRIMGFTVGELLLLCYKFNYSPVNADEFFDVATDVLIRDQERCSALTFLNAALSLSYFNRIPNSFVKYIFNVEFLDKLDLEINNCYAKDVYMAKVRKVLMKLNRAICLEYPEFSIPWFHQKYIERLQIELSEKPVKIKNRAALKEYLQILAGNGNFQENIQLPYGYKVDFLIYLDKYSNQAVTSGDDSNIIKLAVMVEYSKSYTRHRVQLKGPCEFRKRHLEILGYKVRIVKWQDFQKLIYGKEKLEYLKENIFS